MIVGGCENAISRKAAKDASANFKLQSVQSLAVPAKTCQRELLIMLKNLALNCSAAAWFTPNGDEARSDREQVALPLSFSYSSHAITTMAVTHESKSIRQLSQQRQAGR
jgi:hypothetical protein